MPEPILRNLIQPDIRTGQKSTYTPPVQNRTTLEELNPRRFEGPRYFGYHNEASLMARIAQMGLAPNGVNLKIVQEMLRYGLAIGFDGVETLKSLWKQQGGSPLALEALVLMESLGIPKNGKNLDGILQVLSGGPLSHQLARLTMALRGQTAPGIKELERLLGNYWKLGSGNLQLEGKQFQQFYEDLLRRTGDKNRMPAEIAEELEKLERLIESQRLLAAGALYLPFYQWRDKQPLPGELLIQQDESAAAKAAGFVQLTLALETKNLGRVTCNFTLLRGNLSCSLDVQDPKIQQAFQSKIDLLRARINLKTPYTIASLQTNNIGQTRAISILVPKRRDIRRFGRVIGVM